MRFRPCIDLHRGQVKQIVGSTLTAQSGPVVHFAAPHPGSYYAALYARDGLEGGHLIMLGPGNEEAAAAALAAYPQGLQVGGGITPANGPAWLERGARRVIVTSYVFDSGHLHSGRLAEMVSAVGRDGLVLDLSCARRDDGTYVVMADRWRMATEFALTPDGLGELAASCSEFLVHATAAEGRQAGIDAELVALLGQIAPLPTTYAGGIRSPADVELLRRLGGGRLDFTVGSALDLFGGSGLRYADLVALDRRERHARGHAGA
ncbi:MAG: phosphoribosylformimino-5-aminoimidazole carboxamide ribotide isomerase [Candidatus Latescibacterota bacterium]